MSATKDLTGQRFGMLVVIDRSGSDICGNAQWRCVCDCGTVCVKVGYNLRKGTTTSCGCARGGQNKTHGMYRTHLYSAWISMRRRCYKTTASQRYYRDRGITVCDEWNESFIPFMEWALSNGYREGLSIDRIDNDGNYTPENCRWTTSTQQARNTRGVRILPNGKCLAETAEELGMNRRTLQSRLRRMSFEEAIKVDQVVTRNRNKG